MILTDGAKNVLIKIFNILKTTIKSIKLCKRTTRGKIMKPKLCHCVKECFEHKKDIKCCYCNIECDWKEDNQLWYCNICDVHWTTDYNLVNDQPERSKREDPKFGNKAEVVDGILTTENGDRYDLRDAVL
jgi:hypothetical protein